MSMNTIHTQLDVIAGIRSEVVGRRVPTGENLFLAWGYPTVIVLFLAFIALEVWHEFWCEWIWMGIPLIGVPLMMYFLNEDYERTGHRTLDQNVILMIWVFVGFVSCLGGFAMGVANVFSMLYCTFQGVLVGMGCYLTGIIVHFRPKTVCGIVGTALSFLSLFFQGEHWPWQLLVVSVVTVISLIIPGHLFRHYVKNYKNNEQ